MYFSLISRYDAGRNWLLNRCMRGLASQSHATNKAQAGLSWSIVLNKREGYRRAFSEFDPEKWRDIPKSEFKSSHWTRRSPETG